MSLVVYHCHSDLSLLDSCSKFKEYCDLAVQQGMNALGCSEHGRISNWAANKLLCKQNGLKYLHACEVYLTACLDNKVRDNYHTVLIAKDREGTIELNRLMKLASDEHHHYYAPRITFDEFLGLSSHIIKTSACLASPLNKISPSEDIYMKLVRAYDYLEIQHHADDGQRNFNKQLLKLSAQTGIPLIAGTDTHASSKYKSECRDILMLRKEQSHPGEENFDLVWKTEDELLEAYERQGALPRSAYTEAIANTQRMADLVEDWDIDTSIKYPILYGSREADSQKLIELCDIRLKEKLLSGAIPPSEEEAYRKAIKEELDVYEKLQMSGFILSEAELIHWCRTNNIPIGPARGSVSGSRVAYVTDIIDFDPERWGTVFSRFANSHRIEPGDIDTDCIDTDRPKIFAHIKEQYGEDYTARVASYGTIQDLAFIDDCGGGLGIQWEREHHPEKFRNGRLDASGKKKTDVFDKKNPYHPLKLEKIKAEFRTDPEKAKLDHSDLFYYYDGMVGTRVSQSVHPAGMVISPIVLGDEYGVFWKDGELCLTQDMDILHDLGAIKYDMLILRAISVINDSYALMGQKYPRMCDIDWDDQDVWADISKDPSGIFQFESPFAAESIVKFKPKSLFDLSMLNAALRPSGASYRDDLIAHKIHKNPSKQIDDLLKDNNGFLIYQCDILSFLQQICGLNGSDADSVRRGIAKKKMDILEKWLPTILEGYCSHSDKPRAEAEEECKEYLKIIEDASSYMFSKNHSLPYSMIGYLFGYLKYYHPEQFIAAYLMNAANDDDINTGRAMAKSRGIRMTKPRFRQDNRTFYIDPVNHTISDALSSIKGVGLKDAEALWSMKDNNYNTFVELLRDMTLYPGALNTAVIEKLIKLDYFCEFGSIKKLLRLYDEFYNSPHCFKTTLVPASQQKRMNKLIAIETGDNSGVVGFLSGLLDDPKEKTSITIDEDDPLEVVRYECELIGSPMTLLPSAYKGHYAVLEVDTKYSPKVRLQSLTTGNVGMMKILKKTFQKDPLKPGMLIHLDRWKPKEAYGKPGVMENWIDAYTII